MAPTIMSSIVKRESEYAIPQMAIVILCMLGACVLMVIVYGMARFFTGDNIDGIKPLKAEQHEYMAEVRARNLEILEYEARLSMYGHKPRPKDVME
jgi:hypothetical protein